ncbi:GTP cyclohydrolase [Desulfovibrio sp.]|uniref:GTP cyclohydrolase n=1 Tax=Desulfovibrio sp. TaxID=885 RepID=UPI0023CC15AD|nr:GTP cyclohydrolase [Desulfovibrio sp.]MDE7242294.1 GTP cyclohydrolase [Desulfovibrio sp.]
MRARQKATGWKMPLIFCGAILVMVGLGALLRPPPATPPELPGALTAKARALVIDLDTPEGRPWKERIVSAASGFAPPDLKAERLGAVAAEAVAAGRLDAACAAAVQAGDGAGRDAAFAGIFTAAARECATLPWAVFAVHGVRDTERAAALARELTGRWRACGEGRAQMSPPHSR